ncbi:MULTISPECIES: hypothetical protein [unclassified Sphingobacterium]|uniref:hypothetical protein n=1 Tax=unclassified Sphingobacterium TaxID=2609468 RepID=UPI0025F1ECAD|nr:MULTISPECIES: hypothetical protein [unclassified Sphingobacterium]
MISFNWTNWENFPNPLRGEYLFAPFGKGCYQLFNDKRKEFILFGSGNNLAYRMSSLLPKPYGQGTRKNNNKREYILNNIENMLYRTISFLDEKEMKTFEKELKKSEKYIFNT